MLQNVAHFQEHFIFTKHRMDGHVRQTLKPAAKEEYGICCKLVVQ
jgi:hypothetical protein